MRKQLFYNVAVILSICLRSHASFKESSPRKSEHLDKINFEYLCHSKFFDRKTIRNSYRKGCLKLWNAESYNGFPAKLEDDQFVNGAHRTLFSWPLNNDAQRVILNRIGKYRTVFDINCRFYGVLVLREGNYEHCIKLFDRKDVDKDSTNHEEYDIHRCKSVVFGQTYVQASVKAALVADLKPHPNKYPKVYDKIPPALTIFIWPLHLNNDIHGTLAKDTAPLRYYVLYKREDGAISVIERREKKFPACRRESKLIESNAYDSNIIGAQEHIIYDSKKSYDCSGQIFTDKYIQEILTTIRGEIVDSSFTKSRRDAYPKLEDIGPENAMGKSWIWDLRIQEGDYMKSKRRYFIAVDQDFETFDVYHVEQGRYVVCTTRYKQDTTISKSPPSSPEFDFRCPECGQCQYFIDWRCEKDGPDPKRRKLNSLDSNIT